MLADQALCLVACGLLACGSSAVFAEEDAPDAELLEYLGLWDESDEEWLLLDEMVTAGNEERSDPVPEGEESLEKDDEC